jgi:hypothetical protein
LTRFIIESILNERQMLATTHSLASALIVSRIPSPLISFPLIIITHYIMDFIPHWDTGTGLTKGLKSRKKAFRDTIIDLAVAAILVFFFFQLGKKFSVKLWFGVLLGITPDLLESPALFLNYRPLIIAKIEEFQDSFHHSVKFPEGLIPQLFLIALILLIAYFT